MVLLCLVRFLETTSYWCRKTAAGGWEPEKWLQIARGRSGASGREEGVGGRWRRWLRCELRSQDGLQQSESQCGRSMEKSGVSLGVMVQRWVKLFMTWFYGKMSTPASFFCAVIWYPSSITKGAEACKKVDCPRFCTQSNGYVPILYQHDWWILVIHFHMALKFDISTGSEHWISSWKRHMSTNVVYFCARFQLFTGHCRLLTVPRLNPSCCKFVSPVIAGAQLRWSL